MLFENTKTRAVSLLLLYAVVIIALVFSDIRYFSPPSVSPINKVEFSADDASSLESLASSDWQSISLPDSWYKNHQQTEAEQLWYRAEINIEKLSDKPWAVYINGVWIGQGGSFNEPVSRHHNEPLLFDFSPKLLLQG